MRATDLAGQVIAKSVLKCFTDPYYSQVAKKVKIVCNVCFGFYVYNIGSAPKDSKNH